MIQRIADGEEKEKVDFIKLERLLITNTCMHYTSGNQE